MTDDVSAHRILRRQEVIEVTGLSIATLYRWIKEGLFPQAVQLGPNSVGWRWQDVKAWLDSREPAGGAPPADTEAG